LWQHAHHTEAKEVIAVTDHRITIGHSADVRLVVPAAAPAHPIGTGCGPFGISDGPGRIPALPVLYPLPNVTQHVVQSPSIRLLLPYRMRAMLRIATIPGVLSQVLRVIAKAVDAWRARTCSIFPLGFCRQAIQLRAFHSIELTDERLGIVPRHLIDRPLITREE